MTSLVWTVLGLGYLLLGSGKSKVEGQFYSVTIPMDVGTEGAQGTCTSHSFLHLCMQVPLLSSLALFLAREGAPECICAPQF